MHIHKTYRSFINESEQINEDANWYVEKGYITDPSIKNVEDLKRAVEDNVQAALDNFCKDKSIPALTFTGFKTSGNRVYMEVESKKFTGDELGIFQNCLDWAYLHFFNGGELSSGTASDAPDEFFFMPNIWCTLHIKYEGNGLSFNFTKVKGWDDRKDDAMWYSILDKKWYDRNEMIEKEKESK